MSDDKNAEANAEAGDATANGRESNPTPNTDENVSSGGAPDVENTSEGGGQKIIEELRALLGQDVVLIPVRVDKKPINTGWQNTQLSRVSDPVYLEQLLQNNIGVLLGMASGGLCAIDLDDDALVQPFLDLNPLLTYTLRTKGARGVQIWFRVRGEFPRSTKIKTMGGVECGEWRADGNQSVIHGLHPSGCNYRRLVDAPPVSFAFDEINWPADFKLPWAKDEFDVLVEEDGQPFTVSDKGAVVLNQMFFVRRYLIEHRVVFDAGIGEFFEYCQEDGLWKRQTLESVKRAFLLALTQAAKESGHKSIFAKRTDSLVGGMVALLRSFAEKRNVFEKRPTAIHVANGMICFENGEIVLRGFHPDFYSRNQCPHAFDPSAICPRFLLKLLGPALDEDDIRLLQKWAGSVLLGHNPGQRFLLLQGTPGGGKSTVMSILESVIGTVNVSQLRTDHLHDKFELFSYVGKTLLTGKDVSANFLMSKGAYVIKALVGHDLLEVEKKGFNERVQIRGDFNVGITCNADLNIRLEGDVGAWRRRLLVIRYDRPPAAKPIPGFADQLLEEEGPGILRWMVEGASELLGDIARIGNYDLTEGQKARIDTLLDQSDSVKRYVKDCVVKSRDEHITATSLLAGYYDYCENNGWHPMPTRDVHAQFTKHMLEIHRLNLRHDLILEFQGKPHRGYKHARLELGGAN